MRQIATGIVLLIDPGHRPPGGATAYYTSFFQDTLAALALRLRRLEAIRIASTQLFERPQLGLHTFDRGAPEPIEEIKKPEWSATLYDLLSAYARERQKQALARVRFAKRAVWTLAEAREALQRLVGASSDWTALDEYLVAYLVEPKMVPTVH